MRRTSLRVPRGTTSSACDGGGRALGVAWESRKQRRIVHLLRWMDETRAGTRQEFVRIDDNGNENHEEPPPFPHLPARTSATQAATAPGSPRPEEYNAARNCGPCPVVSGRGSTTVCRLARTRTRDAKIVTRTFSSVGFSPPRSPNKSEQVTEQRTNGPFVRCSFGVIRRGECDECVR